MESNQTSATHQMQAAQVKVFFQKQEQIQELVQKQTELKAQLTCLPAQRQDLIEQYEQYSHTILQLSQEMADSVAAINGLLVAEPVDEQMDESSSFELDKIHKDVYPGEDLHDFTIAEYAGFSKGLTVSVKITQPIADLMEHTFSLQLGKNQAHPFTLASPVGMGMVTERIR